MKVRKDDGSERGKEGMWEEGKRESEGEKQSILSRARCVEKGKGGGMQRKEGETIRIWGEGEVKCEGGRKKGKEKGRKEGNKGRREREGGRNGGN